MEALAEKLVLRTCVMVCETNTNVPAISFYRQVGFSMDGVDLSYYTNRDLTDGEVAIFMKRKL
jgi:ribosomal protein S18 acetylase RimI-like enzyme